MTATAPKAHVAPVSLRHLAAALGAEMPRLHGVEIRAGADPNILGVFQDSRKVEPGAVFVVRKGAKSDGATFVADALARGAVAVLVERGQGTSDWGAPVIEVSDVRQAIGRAASLVYGDPSARLEVVGITGTNGKTTTAWLAAAAIQGAGGRPGIVGTVGYVFEDLKLEAPHTTPEADDLMRIVSQMRARGASHLVMEVASHALSQARADALKYRVAAFSNLTQDHLDFHGNMESYGRAKARLFLELAPRVSVINVDDPFGAKLAGELAGRNVLRVSAKGAAEADVASVEAGSFENGIRVRVRTPSGPAVIDSRLIGAHNLDNLLLALGIGVALELPLEPVVRALSAAGIVPGRLERCDRPSDDVMVLVDYAHTPDALDRALAVLRPIAAARGGRVACVFGCGGDRDPTKRAPMGGVVGRLADLAVVTSDNPRSEDPGVIIEQILVGLSGSASQVAIEPDRQRAIQQTIAGAKPGDVVLLAGKGHETYQIVGKVTRHFDDREEARAALAERRAQTARAPQPASKERS